MVLEGISQECLCVCFFLFTFIFSSLLLLIGGSLDGSLLVAFKASERVHFLFCFAYNITEVCRMYKGRGLCA